MHFVCSAVSDIGNIRENNQDNIYLNGFYIDNPMKKRTEYHLKCSDKLLAGVFDGMGGESCGEIASFEAVKILKSYEKMESQTICHHFPIEANNSICNLMKNNGMKRMGTTMAVVSIIDGQMGVCNLGDSPVYLYRNSKLEQLTIDHNEAYMLYEMGLLPYEKIKKDKRKNRLTQYLGIPDDEMLIEPYIRNSIRLLDGDCILLCSDGLTDAIDVEVMEKVLLDKTVTGKDKAEMLIEKALNNGGADNITVILVEVYSD